MQDVLPTAQRYDRAVAEVENCLEPETSMGSKSSSITVSINWVISAFNLFEPGFSIATYHFHDTEVRGPLKGPLNDTFKKARSFFIKAGSPR